jgi:hypothetical protein
MGTVQLTDRLPTHGHTGHRLATRGTPMLEQVPLLLFDTCSKMKHHDAHAAAMHRRIMDSR